MSNDLWLPGKRIRKHLLASNKRFNSGLNSPAQETDKPFGNSEGQVISDRGPLLHPLKDSEGPKALAEKERCRMCCIQARQRSIRAVAKRKQ